MYVSIDVSQVYELADDFDRGAAAFEGKVHLAVAKGGLDVAAHAQVNAPVRTGALRSSIGMDITVDDEGIGFEVGPTVEYGDYVEQGTHGPYLIPNAFGLGITVEHPGEAAQPYLGPAFDVVEPGLTNALADAGLVLGGRP